MEKCYHNKLNYLIMDENVNSQSLLFIEVILMLHYRSHIDATLKKSDLSERDKSRWMTAALNLRIPWKPSPLNGGHARSHNFSTI